MSAGGLTARAARGTLQNYLSALLTESVVAQVDEAAVAAQVATPQEAPVASAVAPAAPSGVPAWAAEGLFECLLFDVAGLQVAAPLVGLGSLYALEGKSLTPLFGQPDWFLGLFNSPQGNYKVIDTARWLMPERYRAQMAEGLRYLITLDNSEWALAVHGVERAVPLRAAQVKWRDRRQQRPWIAGTLIDQMCALLDVEQMLVNLPAPSGTGPAN